MACHNKTLIRDIQTSICNVFLCYVFSEGVVEDYFSVAQLTGSVHICKVFLCYESFYAPPSETSALWCTGIQGIERVFHQSEFSGVL
jgi:hypothetical protein